jgi:hypothetical protein
MLFIPVHAAPKTTYTYVENSFMPRDSTDQRNWDTNRGIRQRRGIGWLGTISITLLNEEEETVHIIEGTVYYWIKNLIINSKTGSRFSCGTVEITVTTVDDLPAVGSIKGTWVSEPNTPTSFKEVLTHGTGFFAGARIEATSTRTWAPGTPPSLTRIAVGKISLPG